MKRQIWKKIVIILGVLLAAEVLVLAYTLHEKRQEVSKNIEESPENTEIEDTEAEYTETESTESWPTESFEVIYPKPSYDFKTDEITVEIPNLSRTYTVAWVSDLQMVTDTQQAEDIREEDLEAVYARFDMFQTEEGVSAERLLPEIIDYLNYGHFDGIIFGGDMIDYCSRSNIDKLQSEFHRLDPNVPVLYIRADHDYGFWYGGDAFTEADAEAMHHEMADGDDLSNKYIDFGEFVILGVNRSTKDMFPWQYDILAGQFDEADAQGKPIVIATHVPYASQIDDQNPVSLYDRAMEVRNKIYYWGGGNYVPNDVTGAFLDRIYAPDTNVIQVLAGHLHAGWDGKLTDRVRQHIFEPAYLGNIGVIRFVPGYNGKE